MLLNFKLSKTNCGNVFNTLNFLNNFFCRLRQRWKPRWYPTPGTMTRTIPAIQSHGPGTLPNHRYEQSEFFIGQISDDVTMTRTIHPITSPERRSKGSSILHVHVYFINGVCCSTYSSWLDNSSHCLRRVQKKKYTKIKVTPTNPLSWSVT